MEFKTELKQLLHIITHSLYSNKEIFLRELISNAADAINKIRFDALSHEHLLEGNTDWKIKILLDKDARTLTISDNGIGLSKETAVENLGTIAKSGTRAFLDALREKQAANRPDLIGQFGVGFYSAFMVADKVTVISRQAGPRENAVRWESDGQGEFTVETITKAERGTDVILHIKEQEKEFLDSWRVRQVIKKFSDFLEHPIVMDVEKEQDGSKLLQEETINARKALWLRSKSENTDEEYREFYKQISHDFNDPLKWLHYTAEGNQEFRVLVYLPKQRPFDMQFGEYEWGLKLYIQRVLIMDHCEALLPPYLRFVRGMVDSSDLPLNISRELLQNNPLLEQIKSNVTRSVLKSLDDLRSDAYNDYVAFFKEFGSFLKEGTRQDYANREKLAELFLFESLKTPTGQFTTLGQYVDAMPEEQKEILYLAGETREQLANSPYLEAVRAKGYDVLFMLDPVDEFMLPGLSTFKGKSLKAVDRASTEESNVDAGEKIKYAKLLEYLESKLPDVTDVRLTTRLKESPCCLVAAEGATSANLERLLTNAGRSEQVSRSRILEINGSHPAVETLLKLYEKNSEDARVENFARLLYDQAVLAEGSRVKDPAAMAKRINDLLIRDAGR
jgi:molecular chaperone HtpG